MNIKWSGKRKKMTFNKSFTSENPGHWVVILGRKNNIHIKFNVCLGHLRFRGLFGRV